MGWDGAVQLNSLAPDEVARSVMLTSAIVFGMVGVAAGFTWDYISSRGATAPKGPGQEG